MKKKIAAVLLSAVLLLSGQVAFAADGAEKQAKTTQSKAEKKAKTVERFQYLFKDNSELYFMDSQNAQWKLLPHSDREYMIDVWIRVVTSDTPEVTEKQGISVSSSEPYYLEHYYIRPSTKQIQFLSELQVTGRPDNTIKERAYSVKNWENIVPGSIEDEIYHSVMKKIKTNKLTGKSKGGMNFHDAVEEIFRISY